jgi:hypothetical protein
MTNYTAMCQALARHVKFNDPSPVGSPLGSPFDGQQLADVVQGAAAAVPRRYASDYADPLAQRLPSLTQELEAEFTQAVQQGQDPEDVKAKTQSIVDTLVGAVRDWNEPRYRASLRRFEAVISNLYRSFLSATQRTSVPLPLIETVPPLTTFAPKPDQGPFTLPADAVKDLIGVPIGVVSLPGSYRDHPLLWPSLAHECGGHDVLHADPGLLKELAAGAAQLPSLPRGIGRLWAGWMDEAASDVYGILNIGPAFAVSLAAFFSALRASQARRRTNLGPISNVLPLLGNAPFDVHPVDLLRVHLAIGVTAQLTSLSATSKTAWLTELGDLATEAGGGATTINVVDVETNSVVQRLPLEPMAEAAQAVGGYIATARLAALDGHSIQDIETWDDLDERAAQTIRKAAAAGKSLVGLGDDAQLLAGTTMALLDDADSYDAITGLLAAGLDDSFARDPVFAPPAPFFMLIDEGGRPQGKGYSRSPAFPTFPLEAFGPVEEEPSARTAPPARHTRASRRASEMGSSRRGQSK